MPRSLHSTIAPTGSAPRAEDQPLPPAATVRGQTIVENADDEDGRKRREPGEHERLPAERQPLHEVPEHAHHDVRGAERDPELEEELAAPVRLPHVVEARDV